MLFGVILLAACNLRPLQSTPTQTSYPSATGSSTPTDTFTTIPTLFPDPNLPAWQHYPGPSNPPIVDIPLPLADLQVPAGVEVITLVGLDREAPFRGRSDTVLLVLYNLQTARASILSIPPDLFVYVPGQSMQRLNSAYPIGGGKLLAQTLEYNFGLKPQAWAAVHLDDFVYLIDALGGIYVEIQQDLPQHCGGVKPGQVRMDGRKALCYATVRLGMDEAGRNSRQVEVLQAIFQRLVNNGGLVLLPGLFQRFHNSVDVSSSLPDLLNLIPLALRLGEADRFSFFTLQDATREWDVPGLVASRAFLPRREELRKILISALAFIAQPSTDGAQLATLQYALTVSATPSRTPTRSATPTRTVPPPRTRTLTPTMTMTRTVTSTRTPTRIRTSTLTLFTTETSTLTPSATLTPDPNP